MEDVKNVVLSKMEDSKYLQPYRMNYVQDGQQKIWDLFRAHNSVSVLIFNLTRKIFVFVKQFRPPVFLTRVCEARDENTQLELGSLDLEGLSTEPGFPVARLGVTLELCAGIVDKNKSLEETAVGEVLEECGYSIAVSKLERIVTYASSVGSAGDSQTLFLALVEDSERVASGGGLADEGELIEVVEMTVDEVKEYLSCGRVNSPSSFLFAVTWFLANRAPSIL